MKVGSGKFVTFWDNDDPRFFVDKKPFLVLFYIITNFVETGMLPFPISYKSCLVGRGTLYIRLILMFVVYPVNSGKLSEEIVDAQKVDEIIWPITIVKGGIV